MAVIVPECKEMMKDNIKRVGPIVRQTKFTQEKSCEKQFSFDKKTMVISIGGTDAGIFLIEKALESVSRINQDIDVVIGFGSFN